MELRYQNTFSKTYHLRELGNDVIEMWGCDFKREMILKEEVRRIVKSFKFIEPLQIRDTFFGGRTEMFWKYARSGESTVIKHLDVCSLYPYICKYGVFLKGHPFIMTEPAQMPKLDDFIKWVGFAKISILPPKKLRLPVLPSKVNGKLIFGLCRECMAISNSEPCTHSDELRTIEGSYAICEIAKALECGYKLIQIYEIWKYAKTQFNKTKREGGVFAEYIDKFLKLKQEASGYPSRVESEDDKDAFVQELKDRENIDLDKSKIEANPGLRSLAKMCLNSLW